MEHLNGESVSVKQSENALHLIARTTKHCRLTDKAGSVEDSVEPYRIYRDIFRDQQTMSDKAGCLIKQVSDKAGYTVVFEI